ncbi:tail fiber assembly protein [Trabulsiella odontotermitis]|uniref:tail fiber assembly protein n=1 Tax=Trabulsiella odontotermitis TaxID=379893 RepID=UPI000675C555|nr:tail assembly chaperone [Trabulsiella odontotermitis]KNC89876.1 hypothetical protein GM30_05855 [Trabulsiella odontotermitis]
MKKYYYSATQNEFLPVEYEKQYRDAGTFPGDAVLIDDAISEEFLAPAPAGKMRAAGSNGLPMWIDVPPLTQEQLVAAAELRKAGLLAEAQSTIINWQSKLLLGIITDDEKASLIAWLAYIDALNAVDTTKPDWPTPPGEQAS